MLFVVDSVKLHLTAVKRRKADARHFPFNTRLGVKRFKYGIRLYMAHHQEEKTPTKSAYPAATYP